MDRDLIPDGSQNELNSLILLDFAISLGTEVEIQKPSFKCITAEGEA